MAIPTETIRTFQQGHNGMTIFTALWDATDNYADEVVVDLSAITTYTNSLRIDKVKWMQTVGIGLTLEFDDDSADEPILYSPPGPTEWNEVDFTEGGRPGIGYAGSGGTGDLVITTTSAASGDAVSIIVYWHAN